MAMPNSQINFGYSPFRGEFLFGPVKSGHQSQVAETGVVGGM